MRVNTPKNSAAGSRIALRNRAHFVGMLSGTPPLISATSTSVSESFDIVGSLNRVQGSCCRAVCLMMNHTCKAALIDHNTEVSLPNQWFPADLTTLHCSDLFPSSSVGGHISQ